MIRELQFAVSSFNITKCFEKSSCGVPAVFHVFKFDFPALFYDERCEVPVSEGIHLVFVLSFHQTEGLY